MRPWLSLAVVLLGPVVGVAGAAGGAAAGTRPATATRAVSGGTWGKAREVPGTATLNAGDYTDSSGRSQAFVVSQT